MISVGMYSTYPKIKETSIKYKYNIFERSEFLRNVNNGNYSIYFDIIKNKENKKLNLSDVVLDFDKNNTYIDENQFDEIIRNNRENLDSNSKNLEYYAVKKDSNLVEERNQGDIAGLLNDSSNNLQALNKKYSFYIVLDYNDKGEMTIKRVYGADKSVVAMEFTNSNNILSFYNGEMKPIKNMSYVYAVPRELKYSDSINIYNDMNEIQAYKGASGFFIEFALICIIIVAIITPYKLSKGLIGFKKIAKIPIEIIVFIFIIALKIIDYEPPSDMITNTIKGNLIDFSHIELSVSHQYAVIDAVNVIYWLICFGIIFIGIVIVKHIFNLGIRTYIKEHSIIYKILTSILRTSKKICSYLRNIDLKEKNTKKLAIILGINLLVLTIMSCLWFLGIIVAIIYTIVLFIVIRKKYEDIIHKYNMLFQATNKMAEGKLDVTIEEDLGVFNDFKKEIESIQNGFKKAVNQEVKSQRMKTELISNVSHDLKTPLTAIITYVDLLKDENLSPEKRKEYLDTLDRKSQRLQELIEDLFEVSKATSGNINLNIVSVDVVALMKQTLLELDDKISEASLIIKPNYTEEKVILQLDSQRMFRVFENLIINITKYAMQGSRVYIDIVAIEDKVEISLKNMTASEIDFDVNDIMERFVRGDKSRNTEGSGLGLAIAKSFIELQGGQLDVKVDGDLFKVLINFTRV